MTVLVCTIMLVAALVSLIATAHSSGSPTPSRSDPLAAQRDRFALLRTPAVTPLPPAFQTAVDRAPDSYALDVPGARENASGVWLIPGSGGMCIAVLDSDGVGMSCQTTEATEAGELTFSAREAATGQEQIVGVAPDGVGTATGFGSDGAAVSSAPVTSSTYAMRARNVQTIGLG
jgi:hypothetical protein